MANVRCGQSSSLLRSRVTYGSFYLRMGAMCECHRINRTLTVVELSKATFGWISVFGIGSMIYSGIEVGMFFEQNLGEDSDCKNLFSVLRPVLQGLTKPFTCYYFV